MCFCCHVIENYGKNFAAEKLAKPKQNYYCSTISLVYGITADYVYENIRLSHSITSDTIPPSVMIYGDNQNHFSPFLNLHFKN